MSEQVDLNRLRRQVAFDRLLARLFLEEPPPWVPKGGYALELRFKAARSTVDIDLTVQKSVGTVMWSFAGFRSDRSYILSAVWWLKTLSISCGRVSSRAVVRCGMETDKFGKVMVKPELSVRDHPQIFVIGDTAHLVAPVRNLLGIKRAPMLMPGLAQPAIQEGKYVAEVIRRRVEGRPQPKPFWYWDKGDLAIVGRTYGVADLRFIRFAGFAGWVLWAGVHIYFLIGFANRLFVLLQWGFDFLTKRRRVRVLSEEPPSAQNLIDPAA